MVSVQATTLDSVEVSDFHGKQAMELPDQLFQNVPFVDDRWVIFSFVISQIPD